MPPCLFLLYRIGRIATMTYLMNTYRRLPLRFERGEGAWLFDTDGKRYLDGVAGVAVNGLGHAHPQLVEAICKQSKKLIHTSNLYEIPEQERLAQRLAMLSGMDRAFFCNSGAEANEAAIKLARLYGHRKEITAPAIVVMEKSFHGRTMATLSATGSRKVQAGFEPLLSGFVRVPYNDIAAVEEVMRLDANIVAVLVEPVQGEGGVNVPAVEYLRDLRALCDKYGVLLMLDEIQTGVARTGKWFAHQHAAIVPDVMTLAKGLGSGIPVGACLARGAIAETFQPGNHGSTFGGNPFAMSVVTATLDIIEAGDLLNKAVERGDFIRAELSRRLSGNPGIVDIRGIGLMIGVELDRPCAELVQRASDRGLLINVTADRVVRLLPPLILSEAEAAELVDIVSGVIADFLADPL